MIKKRCTTTGLYKRIKEFQKSPLNPEQTLHKAVDEHEQTQSSTENVLIPLKTLIDTQKISNIEDCAKLIEKALRDLSARGSN